MPAPADRRVTPMWLAHHWPEDYDRCVRIGRSHVCRRCLVLYPLALATALVIGLLGPVAVTPWLTAAALVVLPLPAVVDFVAEHRGWVQPSARRLVAVTVPLAVGLGAGFARYLEHLADPWFWAVVVVYGGVCAATALWRRRAPSAS
ncbi:MAG: hypothetical protein U0Q07_03180 [Acidimicrobiales bacterium]